MLCPGLCIRSENRVYQQRKSKQSHQCGVSSDPPLQERRGCCCRNHIDRNSRRVASAKSLLPAYGERGAATLRLQAGGCQQHALGVHLQETLDQWNQGRVHHVAGECRAMDCRPPGHEPFQALLADGMQRFGNRAGELIKMIAHQGSINGAAKARQRLGTGIRNQLTNLR